MQTQTVKPHPAQRRGSSPPGRGRRTSFRPVLVTWLAWMAMCWLVVGVLLGPLVPGGWFVVLLLALLLTAPALVLLRGFRGAYPSARTRLWVLRPFWYGQLALPLLAGAGVLGVLFGLPFGAAVPAGRGALAVMAAVMLAAGLLGYAGSRRLVVRPLIAEFEQLPPGLEGLRIAQVSDLHVGPHTSRRFLARVAAAVQGARPDLIAITGDQVDDFARDVEHFAKAFGELSAPLGTFAVAGNHDVYAGWDGVRAGLETMGATVLVNRSVVVERNGARLQVVGTGDPAGRHWARDGGRAAAPDVERALAGVRRDEFTLALAHNPALWPALAAQGVDLTLSGHTHHGQLSIPRLGWSLASAFLEHAMGSHRQDGSLLYIHPGTNFWGIPFRIGALPEVTVLTLRRSHSSQSRIFAHPADHATSEPGRARVRWSGQDPHPLESD